ncbi:hypothetical protein SAMN05428961_11095 [Paenibacillus sp. OK060]|uniref:hypothetical protein n=1 Tax=Paenibacillus sp. OK060 TaxID=1881034 RepID=UPI000886B2F8|nr:hypothetical protein [Paenibacillus sp. OK060]SDM15569.1 hypothetical protein SAMN05428961_11095 [Paenibacillus sp. OK060]
MESVTEILKRLEKEREEGLKVNPRYDIDKLADENGEVLIYFHSSKEYQMYLDGKSVIGSTERFLHSDIFRNVQKDRIEKLTDGRTLAHIPALSANDEV